MMTHKLSFFVKFHPSLVFCSYCVAVFIFFCVDLMANVTKDQTIHNAYRWARRQGLPVRDTRPERVAVFRCVLNTPAQHPRWRRVSTSTDIMDERWSCSECRFSTRSVTSSGPGWSTSERPSRYTGKHCFFGWLHSVVRAQRSNETPPLLLRR